MRHRRAFREFVKTPFGRQLRREIDVINFLARGPVWEQEEKKLALECPHWQLRCTETARRVDRIEGNPRLSRFFLNRIDEQISRAELIESARLGDK